MPVFNLCLKIIKKNIPAMSIYIVIFVLITVLFAQLGGTEQQTSFTQAKVKMALFVEDESPFIEGFVEKLSEYADFIEVPDEPEALQDALFFQSVNYILRIPAGFTESFMKGENPLLIKTIVPASATGAYIDIMVDQYFNTARLYVDGVPGISQEEIVNNVKTALASEVAVQIQSEAVKPVDYVFAKNYFNYLAYSLFAVLILGISTIMIVFNNDDIKRRNNCAPLSSFRMNLEFLLSQLFFTLISWSIMIAFYVLLSPNKLGSNNTIYFIVNSLIFALCASSISFFIGSFVKNQNALSAISNVATLVPCFISGIFVPQELLGSAVLKVASFTPTYWFAKANGEIANLVSFDLKHLEPVLKAMTIEVGFAVAFITLALVLNKKRSVSN
ncbi:MAG: ABC transporter permease [Vallitaleaceae bacterium]|nr:ABC transporter permease [Vallitaleaceae bacterium]